MISRFKYVDPDLDTAILGINVSVDMTDFFRHRLFAQNITNFYLIEADRFSTVCRPVLMHEASKGWLSQRNSAILTKACSLLSIHNAQTPIENS